MTGQEVFECLGKFTPEQRAYIVCTAPNSPTGYAISSIFIEDRWHKVCPCSDCDTPEQCDNVPPVIVIA